jgi:hypothetical protein
VPLRRGKLRILGKEVKDFIPDKPLDLSLTPPEEHYESTCEQEEKMACYRLKAP